MHRTVDKIVSIEKFVCKIYVLDKVVFDVW